MISVITNSRDDAKFARMSRSYAAALAGVEHEIVRIADATGMCEGYNRGLAQARGDRLLFVHDDTEILFDDFAQTLAGHFERFDVFGPAGTNKLVRPPWPCVGVPYILGMVCHVHPHTWCVDAYATQQRAFEGAQALDGLFIAATREACERVGKWDELTFTGWHLYDLDFSYRAHLAGLRCGIVCDLGVKHELPPNKLTVTDTPDYRTPAKKFTQKHRPTLPEPPAKWRSSITTGVAVSGPQEAVSVMREILAFAR